MHPYEDDSWKVKMQHLFQCLELCQYNYDYNISSMLAVTEKRAHVIRVAIEYDLNAISLMISLLIQSSWQQPIAKSNITETHLDFTRSTEINLLLKCIKRFLLSPLHVLLSAYIILYEINMVEKPSPSMGASKVEWCCS